MVRVLVLGGTRFLGRRIVERLHDRGDELLLVHRGRHQPDPWIPVAHLYTDRLRIVDHADHIGSFAPDADTCALTAADVDAVTPTMPSVPTVVLSSQDVYQAYSALQGGGCDARVPITETSELRRERYPYRGTGLPGIPDDYDKLDVEERWLARGAVARAQHLLGWAPADPRASRRGVGALAHRQPTGRANLVRHR